MSARLSLRLSVSISEAPTEADLHTFLFLGLVGKSVKKLQICLKIGPKYRILYTNFPPKCSPLVVIKISLQCSPPIQNSIKFKT